MSIQLNNTESVESRLPIEPLMDKTTKKLYHDGIPFVKLIRVSVATVKHEKGEYANLEVPELQFEFINHKLASDEPDRFLLQREKAIHSMTANGGSEDMTPMDQDTIEKLTQSMWQRIKHIHDSFRMSPNWKDFALMTKEEVAEYMVLRHDGTPEERVEMFTKFFTFIADHFNNTSAGEDAEPIFKNGSTYHIMRLKVVADFKTGNRYGLPTFVKQGFIEPARKKDNKFVSPVTVYKQPTDKFELTEGKSKSSVVSGIANAGAAAADSLLDSMGI